MAEEAEVAEVETPEQAAPADPGDFAPEPVKQENKGVENTPPASPEEPEAGEQEPEVGVDEPKLSPVLLEKAQSYGWDEDSLKGIDPTQLERLILRAEVARLTPAPEKKAEAPKVEEFKLEFPEEFDPAAKEAIEKLHGHYSKTVQGLTEKLDSALRYVEHQQLQALDERLSGLFEGLGEEYQEAFGKGKMAEVTDTPAGKKRVEVLKHMDILERGYTSRGEKLPSEKELFRAAVALVSPVDVKKAASRELSQKLKDGKKNLFVRPKNREKSDTPHGYDKAVASVTAKLEALRQTETPAKFE